MDRVYSELDFTSKSFNPIKALKCKNMHLPYPKAKTYDNITDWYNHTFGRKKADGISRKAPKNECFVLMKNYEWFYETLGLDMPENFDIKDRYLKCLPKKKRTITSGKDQVGKAVIVKEMPSEMLKPIRSSKIVVKRSDGTVREYVYPNSNKSNKCENVQEIPMSSVNTSDSDAKNTLFENKCLAGDKKSMLPCSEINEGDKRYVKQSEVNLQTSCDNDFNHKTNNSCKNIQDENTEGKRESSNSPDILKVLNNLANSVLPPATMQSTKILKGVDHATTSGDYFFLDSEKFLLPPKEFARGKENSKVTEKSSKSANQCLSHKIKDTSFDISGIKSKTNSEDITDKKLCSIQKDSSSKSDNCSSSHALNIKSDLMNTVYGVSKPVSEKSCSELKKSNVTSNKNTYARNSRYSDCKRKSEMSNNQYLNNKKRNTNYDSPILNNTNMEVIAEKKQYALKKDLNSELGNHRNHASNTKSDSVAEHAILKSVSEKSCSQIKKSSVISYENKNRNDVDNNISEKWCDDTESHSKKKSDNQYLNNKNKNTDEKPVQNKTFSEVMEKEPCSIQSGINSNSENYSSSHSSNTKSNSVAVHAILKPVSGKSFTQILKSSVISNENKNRNDGSNHISEKWCDDTESHSKKKSDNQYLNHKNKNIDEIPVQNKKISEVIMEKEPCPIQSGINSNSDRYSSSHLSNTKSNSVTVCGILEPASERSCSSQTKKSNIISKENKNRCDAGNNISEKLCDDTDSHSKKKADNQCFKHKSKNTYEEQVESKTNSEIIFEKEPCSFQNDLNSEFKKYSSSHTSNTKSNSVTVSDILKLVPETSCSTQMKNSSIVSNENKNICDTRSNSKDKPDNQYFNHKIKNTNEDLIGEQINTKVIEKESCSIQKDLNSETENYSNIHTLDTKCDSMDAVHGVLEPVSDKSSTQIKNDTITENKMACAESDISRNSYDKTISNSKKKSIISNNQYLDNRNIIADNDRPVKTKTEKISKKKQSSIQKDPHFELDNYTSSHTSNSLNTVSDILRHVSEKSCSSQAIKSNIKTGVDNENKNKCGNGIITEKLCVETGSHTIQKLVKSDNQYFDHKIKNTDYKKPIYNKTNTEATTEKEPCFIEKSLNSELQICDSNQKNLVVQPVSEKSSNTQTKKRNMNARVDHENKNKCSAGIGITKKVCGETGSNPIKELVKSDNQYIDHKIKNADYKKPIYNKTNTEVMTEKEPYFIEKSPNSELQNCDLNQKNLVVKPVSEKSSNAQTKKRNMNTRVNHENKNKCGSGNGIITEKLCDETGSHTMNKLVKSDNQYFDHKIENADYKKPIYNKTNTEVMTEKEPCFIEKSVNSELQNCDPNQKNPVVQPVSEKCSNTQTKKGNSNTRVDHENKNKCGAGNGIITEKLCDETGSNPIKKLMKAENQYFEHKIKNADYEKPVTSKTNSKVTTEKEPGFNEKSFKLFELQNCEPNRTLNAKPSVSFDPLCNVLKPSTKELCTPMEMNIISTVNNTCDKTVNPEKLCNGPELSPKEKSLLELARKARNKLRSRAIMQ